MSVLLFLFVFIISCKPVSEFGTIDQAIAARDTIPAGDIRLSQIDTEFSNLLNRFRDVAPAKMLINASTTEALSPTPYPELVPHFGLYTETAPGVFQHTQDDPELSLMVQVNYANGIVLLMKGFGYRSMDPEQRVSSYDLSVTSHNGVTTPAAEEVTMDISIHMLPLLAIDFEVDDPQIPLIPSYQRISANSVSYVDSNGSPVTYWIDITNSVSQQAAPTPGFGIVRKFMASLKGSASSLRLSRNISNQYEPSGIAGTWVGYGRMDYLYALDGNRLDYYEISFSPTLQDNGTDVLVSYVAEAKNRTWMDVLYNNKIVGSVSGAYNCDVNIPTNIGSGSGIVIEWLDKETTAILPGVYSCSDLVYVEPTTP